MTSLLSINGLYIEHEDDPGNSIVRSVDVSLERGSVLGIVGETGAGKTLTMRALLGSLPEGLTARYSSAAYDGVTLDDLPRTMRTMRGDRIGIVVQDPLGALPPTQTVGRSLTTLLRTHRRMTKPEARDKILEVFREVGLQDAERVFALRPYELSGGMAQRVVIAAAFMTDPDLIVADEPTTALDPTVQMQILRLLKREVVSRNVGAVIITHDMGVVSEVCTHVVVLYDGEVREAGLVANVMSNPQDDYTRELLGSITPTPPRSVSDEPTAKEIIAAERVVKRFGRRAPAVLSDVSITVKSGRTHAIVGESGAGKTTLLRALLKLIDIDEGSITIDGDDVTEMSSARFRSRRRDLQVVYQNPTAALNPRLTVRQLIEEPLRAFPECAPTDADRRARVLELLDAVRLGPDYIDRYPVHLSGGQRQRVAIARALATSPKIVVLDEPTASLDVSVRRHILELLSDLQRQHGFAYVLVSHDFHAVRTLAHHVTVLLRGRVVETGPADVVLSNPTDDYTKKLLASELRIGSRADTADIEVQVGTEKDLAE